MTVVYEQEALEPNTSRSVSGGPHVMVILVLVLKR